MEKELVKFLITDYQRIVKDIKLVGRYMPLENALNYVFVGLRRAGKSYLIYQQIQNLLKKGHSIDEILYFNFEDDRLYNLNISTLDLTKTCYEEIFDHKPIFFLDEIQIIDGWEKFARRLADQNYRVYITGSNAKMLSSEIATTLGGRYMIQNVFPFDFNEFLQAHNINLSEKNAEIKNSAKINKLYETYFQFGGLPELLNVSDKRMYISNLYQKIFFGDLVSRYKIRNDYALKILVRKLAENVKSPTSFSRLANVVSASGKKITTDTVIDYLQYLKDSWLIFPVENICAKLAEKESNKKYYFIDNGILNLFLIDPNTHLLENQVAIRLRQIYGNDFYFYSHNVEVDFYIPENQTAIQVSYSIKDAETRKREINALLQISKRLEVKKMLIITKDEQKIITENGVEIEVIPIKKWLLSK